MSQIVVPLVRRQFYPDVAVPQNRSVINRIYATHKAIIDKWAGFCGVDPAIVVTFIFIESRGDAKAKGGAALGLMQVDPATATTAIFEAFKNGLVTIEWELYLTRLIGVNRLLAIKRMKNQTPIKGSTFSSSELLRPELNLMAGTTLLRVLINRHTENGLIRFDKVIYNYNAGMNRKTPLGVSPDEFVKLLNPTSASYVAKAVGPNGILTDLKSTLLAVLTPKSTLPYYYG